MAVKNTVEVVIAGKVYKLCGFESQEYLHRVAAYVNGKIEELASSEGYKRQNADLRQLLLDMNLADDYFKEKEKADSLYADLEKKDKELYSTRHDLVEAQLEIENLKKSTREEIESVKKSAQEEIESVKKSAQEEIDSAKKSAQGRPGGRSQTK